MNGKIKVIVQWVFWYAVFVAFFFLATKWYGLKNPHVYSAISEWEWWHYFISKYSLVIMLKLHPFIWLVIASIGAILLTLAISPTFSSPTTIKGKQR